MERETHRDRETRGGAGRQPGPAAPAPAPAPVRRGRCGAQADGAIRPRQLLTPRQAQGPAWGAGGVRAPPAPRGPRSTAPWSPRALPHPSPPHLCWGPRCPRVLRPAARGGSVHTRTQPALPAACCEAVGPPRAAAGAAAAKPSPARAASASGPVPPRLRLPRERHGLAGGGVRPGRSGHRRPGPALLSRSRFSRSFWSFRGFALLHVLESAY